MATRTQSLKHRAGYEPQERCFFHSTRFAPHRTVTVDMSIRDEGRPLDIQSISKRHKNFSTPAAVDFFCGLSFDSRERSYNSFHIVDSLKTIPWRLAVFFCSTFWNFTIPLALKPCPILPE